MNMATQLEIRDSTAEFLTFVAEGREQGVQVLYKDETVWATQKAMALLLDCSTDNIGLHLKNIYDTNELDKEATTEKISVVQQEGTREVRRSTLFYNLDAVISVGYRVNSIRATQFRQWCTYVIRQFSLRGYIIDKKRMENGSFIGEDYFEHLLAEIREIRMSERRFYQKLTDIYSTAGWAYAGVTMQTPMLVRSVFGNKNYAPIYSNISIAIAIGGAIAAGGWRLLADVTSYRNILMTGIVLLIVCETIGIYSLRYGNKE